MRLVGGNDGRGTWSRSVLLGNYWEWLKGGESNNDGDKDGTTQNCPRAYGQHVRETTEGRRKR